MALLKDTRKKDWFWLENSVIDREDLTIYEKMVYIVLARHANHESACFPSYSTIAKKVGCSTRKVKDVVKELVQKNLIVKQSRKNGETKENESNIYYVKSSKDISVYGECDAQGSEQDAQQVVNEVHNRGECDAQQVVNEVHSNNTNINNTNIRNIYMDLSFLDLDIEHVKITEQEYEKLIKKYGVDYIANQILNLENYIVNGKGNKYKSHYKVLLTWGNMDLKKGNLVLLKEKNSFLKSPQNSNNYPQSYPNYQHYQQDGYNPNQLDLDY